MNTFDKIRLPESFYSGNRMVTYELICIEYFGFSIKQKLTKSTICEFLTCFKILIVTPAGF